MRSNHAGETGAVEIYKGALSALDLRRKLLAPSSYDDDLKEFATAHRQSEQLHLDLLNEILDRNEVSKLLPLWVFCGRSLGFVSTVWCPRGMYLTTSAVESFVETHYKYQIQKLEENIEFEWQSELKQMLEFCCEDEIHHKEEAEAKAKTGPKPWLKSVDNVWKAFVGAGSALAAEASKRV
eukprot:g3196.t1